MVCFLLVDVIVGGFCVLVEGLDGLQLCGLFRICLIFTCVSSAAGDLSWVVGFWVVCSFGGCLCFAVVWSLGFVPLVVVLCFWCFVCGLMDCAVVYGDLGVK